MSYPSEGIWEEHCEHCGSRLIYGRCEYCNPRGNDPVSSEEVTKDLNFIRESGTISDGPGHASEVSGTERVIETGHCRLCGVRLTAENTPHPSDGKFCGMCNAVREQWRRTHSSGRTILQVDVSGSMGPITPKKEEPSQSVEDRPRKINWKGNEGVGDEKMT